MSLQRTVNRNLLRFTIGRSMHCPVAHEADSDPCGKPLDYRDATAAFLHNSLVAIGCTECMDRILESVGDTINPDIEVIRGVDL